MIVADTSAWIGNLKGHNHILAVQKLRDPNVLAQLIIGDITLSEVLQGAKDDREAARLEADLRAFPIVTMGGDVLAVHAAKNYRTMRTVGFTMSKLADLYIGTYCILNNHNLLHCDSDFDPMEQHCGLQVER